MQRQAITPPYALPAFLEQLCRDLRQHEAARQQRDYAEAARFNPLRFLDSRENGLSRILAFLLDPQESHAQGGLFLDAFLKAADLHRFLAYDSVEVGTEKVLKNSRRKHDIRILGRLKGKTVWAVSIENKLCGAPDREGQVGSYLADLKEYADDYCLIYLPPFECVPDAASVDPEELEQHRIGGRFKILVAESLAEWLENTPSHAGRINDFNAYFARYIKENIMGQETSAPELPDHITARPEHLQSALYLIANQNEIFNRLLDTLAAQLEEKFANAFPDLADAGWTVEKYGDYPAKNVCILFKSPSGGLAVGIEGENRLFGKIYGFAYADKEDAHETELASVEAAWDRLPALSEPPFEAELLDIKNDDGDIVRRMMWRYLPDGLSDWDSGTWLRVADGSLAREIFKILRPLAAVVHP